MIGTKWLPQIARYAYPRNIHVHKFFMHLYYFQGLVNVVGSVFAEMRAKNLTGHIVVISSNAGRIPFPGLAVYCGTKFFVEGFLRSLRLESKPNKIVITSIQPGDVATPGQQWTTDKEVRELSKICKPLGNLN